MRPNQAVRPVRRAAVTRPRSIRQSPGRTGAKDRPAVLLSYGEMAYSDQWGYWRGNMTGDVPGQAEFHEQARNFEKDGIEYYFEDFTIKTTDGDLRGTKNGVYDLKTGEFWDHGRVAEATGRWVRLEGSLVFEKAKTTTPGVFPIIGHQTPLIFVPPHPRPDRGRRALVCRANLQTDLPRHSRRGTLAGGIRGTVELREREPGYVIGDTEYFLETFAVEAQGKTLRGSNIGERDRGTGEFWACGRVAETSGSWDRFMGAMTVLWGTASAGRHPSAGPELGSFIVVPVSAA